MLKTSSILLVFILPVSLVVLTRICPAKNHPGSDETVISESEARRIKAEERRAERAEVRKARRAIIKAKEKEQQSLEESEKWFAEKDGAFGFHDNREQNGFEENPAPGMMPLPMPPVLPNMAYGRMGSGRGIEDGDGLDDFGYSPNAAFDGYGANGYGTDFGNRFRRF